MIDESTIKVEVELIFANIANFYHSNIHQSLVNLSCNLSMPCKYKILQSRQHKVEFWTERSVKSDVSPTLSAIYVPSKSCYTILYQLKWSTQKTVQALAKIISGSPRRVSAKLKLKIINFLYFSFTHLPRLLNVFLRFGSFRIRKIPTWDVLSTSFGCFWVSVDGYQKRYKMTTPKRVVKKILHLMMRNDANLSHTLDYIRHNKESENSISWCLRFYDDFSRREKCKFNIFLIANQKEKKGTKYLHSKIPCLPDQKKKQDEKIASRQLKRPNKLVGRLSGLEIFVILYELNNDTTRLETQEIAVSIIQIIIFNF